MPGGDNGSAGGTAHLSNAAVVIQAILKDDEPEHSYLVRVREPDEDRPSNDKEEAS
jgi:hypothetical protein